MGKRKETKSEWREDVHEIGQHLQPALETRATYSSERYNKVHKQV